MLLDDDDWKDSFLDPFVLMAMLNPTYSLTDPMGWYVFIMLNLTEVLNA